MVLAAFVFFLVGFFIAMAFAATALMAGLMVMSWEGMMVSSTFTVIAAVILAAGLAVGYGLLSAHEWARWTGVVLAGLITLSAGMGVVTIVAGAVAVATSSEVADFVDEMDKVQKEGPQDPEAPNLQFQNFLYAMLGFYGLPLAVGLLLGGTALWALLNGQRAAWFRFASEIRAEHRLVRERLAA